LVPVFLTTEELLYGLVDEPDEVLRLVNEISALIQQYYDEITEIIKQSFMEDDKMKYIRRSGGWE
jgi:2-iminoacetate synthase ThiH